MKINKDQTRLFALQANICKTLADPTRLMILHELREGEKSVGQLVSILDLPQTNVSRHLAVLREGGVVATRREGTTICYSLTSPRIGEVCDLVRQVLESQLTSARNLATSLASFRRSSSEKRSA